jgi:Zn-dependent peptidase ImmA (M78 family)
MNKKIEKLASKILEQFGIDEVPIPVEKIAKLKGLQVLSYDLGEDVSGVLVMDNGTSTIGYNMAQSKVRQRFTVAHELGHYELHKSDTGIFIDNNFRVEFRNQDSSTGEYLKEQEANAFAAALLMPQDFLIREIESRDYHLSDEKSIHELAKTFNVSTMAMTYRIANLNLFLKY